MSRVSSKFGKLIKEFLVRNGLTFRGAALQTGISAAYWKDMSDGRVPSEEVIQRISAAFHDLDENELRLAAGYSVKPDNIDAVQAVEFALRGHKGIPPEGKRQILDFVREIEERYCKTQDRQK
ncbi:MAG: helix-turn-helix domain-containing protein [Armatimonadetes bacterium]|nr:helix-turn-helix domain-containing protein [Armatimonadota bacterium]